MQLPGELDDLYQDIILDHYKSPRNRGSVDHADLHSEGFNPFCGDQVILTAGLDDNARIARVGFDGQGCSISQASASMLTDHLRGKTIDEAEELVRAFKGIMQGDEISEEARGGARRHRRAAGRTPVSYPHQVRATGLDHAPGRDRGVPQLARELALGGRFVATSQLPAGLG